MNVRIMGGSQAEFPKNSCTKKPILSKNVGLGYQPRKSFRYSVTHLPTALSKHSNNRKCQSDSNDLFYF